jgi:hypothetical protein
MAFSISPTDPIHARWESTAAALGLGLFFPVGAFDARATFKTHKRILGQPASRASVWAWMFGARGNGEVIVCAHTREPDGKPLTSVVARIDPPLFLGIEAWRGASGLFNGRSWVPTRTAELFARAPTALAALAAIPGAASSTLMDSTVTVHAAGILADATQLRYIVETARTAATSLGESRRRLPKTDGERAQEAAWEAFASEEKLAFDPERLELSGPLAGGKLRIALEAEPLSAVTTVDVELPGRLGLGLSVTKQRGPSIFNSLIGVVDLPTGDAYFDEAFVVRGQHAVQVQRLLFHAPLRRTIDELGRGVRTLPSLY